MRRVSAEKERLLNRRVKELNGLASKTKFPVREDIQDLQSFARNAIIACMPVPFKDLCNSELLLFQE